MKRFIIIFAAALVAMASCSKQEMNESEKGMGALSVSMSLSEQTRTAMTNEELINSAKVNIYKADFSGLVRSYTYSTMPSPFYLAADTYRVDVIAGEAAKAEPAVASWEQKSYKGSQEFTIVAGENKTVEVVAGVNNAVTNVSFGETIAENFNEGYTFTIGLDTDGENAPATQLVYDASKSGAEGYFIVAGLYEPSLTWTFSGNLKKDGSTFTKTGVIENVEPGKLYKMNLIYTIKDGELEFSLVVDYSTDIVDDTIIFEPVSTGLSATPAYEVWATHTTVYADVDATENEGKTVKFGYKVAGAEDDYTYVDGEETTTGSGSWKAELTGLTPATDYQYILYIDGEQIGEPLTFTTEEAPALPNGSFEYVSKVTGKDYYKFYDPNCGVEEGQTMFWGSGNGEGPDGVNGSASMGYVITNIDTNDKKDGNQSIVCSNSAAQFGSINMLTAGNLFTGQFYGLVGTEGGMVNFGRPWTSRPTALRIWCKYNTDKIDILNNNNLGVATTDYDRAQIKVAIGTWNYKTYGGTKDSPVQVNTTVPSTFVDFYTDANTIANGDLIIYNDGYSINKGTKKEATTSGWIEYTIPLDYHDGKLATDPTHIIISCATSQFGDYFTGCKSAKLWIDKAELVY